jgi:transposase
MQVGKVQLKVAERELVGPPQSVGERSEPERSGGPTSSAGMVANRGAEEQPIPNPEVMARPIRRRFTVDYKRRILREADASSRGGIAALLRREGLYSSNLTFWRRQETAGLEPQKRGRKAVPRNSLAGEVHQLRREKERLQKRLRQAETIIEVQKKLCEVLGLPVATTDSDESNE